MVGSNSVYVWGERQGLYPTVFSPVKSTVWCALREDLLFSVFRIKSETDKWLLKIWCDKLSLSKNQDNG